MSFKVHITPRSKLIETDLQFRSAICFRNFGDQVQYDGNFEQFGDLGIAGNQVGDVATMKEIPEISDLLVVVKAFECRKRSCLFWKPRAILPLLSNCIRTTSDHHMATLPHCTVEEPEDPIEQLVPANRVTLFCEVVIDLIEGIQNDADTLLVKSKGNKLIG